MNIMKEQTGLSVPFTLMDLSTHLTTILGEYGLVFDDSHQPVKVGPDVYMFRATELVEVCKKHGHCKVSHYYCLTGGEYVMILDMNQNVIIGSD
jgi:hypothetical protein